MAVFERDREVEARRWEWADEWEAGPEEDGMSSAERTQWEAAMEAAWEEGERPDESA